MSLIEYRVVFAHYLIFMRVTWIEKHHSLGESPIYIGKAINYRQMDITLPNEQAHREPR